MAAKHVVEVPLPEGIEPGREEIELSRQLQERGWTVRICPGWIVEARRGSDVERAAGRTQAEALAELESLARMDEAVPTY
jgi:hypothetical protein